MNNPVSIAQDKFKEMGIVIPPEVTAAADRAYSIQIARERERQEAAELRKGRLQRFAEGYIQRYPMLQDAVTKLGNWSMAVIKLFAVNGLASLVMVFSVIAEWLRVDSGLAASIVDANGFAIKLLSAVMVFAVVLCSFLRYYAEAEANYVEPEKHQWSLRLVMLDWRYRLGLDSGKDEKGKWKARNKVKRNPARRIILTQKIVQAGVVIAALYGSMFHTITGHKGDWSQAIVAIATESTLQEFATWIIGIMITIAILAITDMTSNYVASRAMLLEKSTFLQDANDKLEMQGLEAASKVLWTYYNQLRKGRALQPSPVNNAPSTPPITSATPAALPRHNSGSIPIKPMSDDTLDRQTDSRQAPDKALGGKAALVRQHFTDNPADLSVDVRTVAAKLGVGKDTVNNVRKEFTRQTDN